jgi:hypothetical protein
MNHKSAATLYGIKSCDTMKKARVSLVCSRTRTVGVGRLGGAQLVSRHEYRKRLGKVLVPLLEHLKRWQ